MLLRKVVAIGATGPDKGSWLAWLSGHPSHPGFQAAAVCIYSSLPWSKERRLHFLFPHSLDCHSPSPKWKESNHPARETLWAFWGLSEDGRDKSEVCFMSFVLYSPAALWSSQFPTSDRSACSSWWVLFFFPPLWFFVRWKEDAIKPHFRCIIKLKEAGLWQLQAGGVCSTVSAAPLREVWNQRSFQKFCHYLLGLQQRGIAQSHLVYH